MFQTSQWKKFQELEGRKTFKISCHKFDALIVKYPLPFGKNYLYCPRGPIWLHKGAQPNQETIKLFLSQVKKLTREQKSIFLRIDNLKLNNQSIKNLRLAPSNYFYSAVFLSPAEARLNIQQPDEILLRQMKPKTRYNIRLSLKKNLTLTSGRENKLDEFYYLLRETGQRNHFSIHPKIHYLHLLQAFNQQSKIYLVKSHNKILAAGLYIFYHPTVYYLHGASSSQHRNLMPTYFLHWKVITDAREQKYQFYNFGSVSPQEKKSPWQGIDQFKYNFGAEKITYPWACDLINQPFWYQIYLASHRIRIKPKNNLKNQNSKIKNTN